MLSCSDRRHVLFYLLLALTATDECARTAWLTRAQEYCRGSTPIYADLEVLAKSKREDIRDEIDTVMGMLEIEQGVAAQDRGTKQCAATRYLRWQNAKCPHQAASR
jgi:hypothetical protein